MLLRRMLVGRSAVLGSILALGVTSTGTPAVAAPASWLYLDLNGSGGFTIPTVVTGADTPTLAQFGGGTTAGAMVGPFLFGVSSNYTYVAHYSEVVAATGNFKGSRWDIAAPTLGIRIGRWMLKAEGEVLGFYKLTQLTADGARVQYKKPLGLRAVALWDWGRVVSLGGHFEYVQFATQNTSTTGDTTLSPKFKLLQAGLSVGLRIL